MSLIKCNGLSLGYDGAIAAEGISFTVEKGDFLFVLGENGSGKSTLLKALLGIHPPIGGSLSVSDELKNGGIGYLPQQTQVQKDFPASVYEVVLSGCSAKNGLRPFYSAELKRRATDKLKRLRIESLVSRSYRCLSGGQQQRVLLARALAAADTALILDEPTAGLDAASSAEMYSELERLNREDGMTVITVSHDFDAARRYATSVLSLGSSFFFGRAEEYFGRAVKGGAAQ